MSIRFNPPFRLRHVFSTKSIAPNREHAVFSERTPEVYTNLSCWRFVFYWERITAIDSLLSPLRGNACGVSKRAFGLFSCVCQIASTLCFACVPFLAPKSLRQIGSLWFFGTNSGSVYEPLMWEVRFVLGKRGGDRSIGKANLRKGLCPFNGWHASCPLFFAKLVSRLSKRRGRLGGG